MARSREELAEMAATLRRVLAAYRRSPWAYPLRHSATEEEAYANPGRPSFLDKYAETEQLARRLRIPLPFLPSGAQRDPIPSRGYPARVGMGRAPRL